MPAPAGRRAALPSGDRDARVGCPAAAASAGQGTVVAYEADEIDPASRMGWSMVVTGLAWPVDEHRLAARYREALQPWVAGKMGYVIRIDPQIVTGFELIPGESPAAT